MLDSQLTARTFPATITREFYFQHLFLELPCFIILLNRLLSPPTPFRIENYLFLWKALASAAADNYEAKRPSSPSPAEANGRSEGFPAAGGMVPACSGPKASLRSRGCGRRAASADSEAEARFKTTFARSLPRRAEGKLRQLADGSMAFSSSSHFESPTPSGAAWVSLSSGCFPAGRARVACCTRRALGGTFGCFA